MKRRYPSWAQKGKQAITLRELRTVGGNVIPAGEVVEIEDRWKGLAIRTLHRIGTDSKRIFMTRVAVSDLSPCLDGEVEE